MSPIPRPLHPSSLLSVTIVAGTVLAGLLCPTTSPSAEERRLQTAEVVYDTDTDTDTGTTRSLTGHRTFSRGLKFKPQEAYRSLPTVTPDRALAPPAADLSPWVPPPKDQGDQASCVGWSVGYALRGYYANRAAGRTTQQGSAILSPSFVYNQIVDGSEGCDSGSLIADALTLLKETGDVPMSRFPYRDSDCRRQPAPPVLQEATQLRIAGWRAITVSRINDIKAQVARGDPVVIGMTVDDDFSDLRGDRVYDNRGREGDGHAMVVVGYNDARNAFKLVNSWGKAWGNGGFGWVSYESFRARVDEAYVASVPGLPPLTPPHAPPAPAPTSILAPPPTILAPPPSVPTPTVLAPPPAVVTPRPAPVPPANQAPPPFLLQNFLNQPAPSPPPLPQLPPQVATQVPATVQPPDGLTAKGREGFEAFLVARTNKAFAVGPDGAWGWRSGRSSVTEATEAALEACTRHSSRKCVLVMVNDQPTGNRPSRDAPSDSDVNVLDEDDD